MGKEIKLNDNQVWTGVVGGVIAGMILIISDSFGEMFSGGIKLL